MAMQACTHAELQTDLLHSKFWYHNDKPGANPALNIVGIISIALTYANLRPLGAGHCCQA